MERIKLRLYFVIYAIVHRGMCGFQMFCHVECAIICARVGLFSVASVCVVTQLIRELTAH